MTPNKNQLNQLVLHYLMLIYERSMNAVAPRAINYCRHRSAHTEIITIMYIMYLLCITIVSIP